MLHLTHKTTRVEGKPSFDFVLRSGALTYECSPPETFLHVDREDPLASIVFAALNALVYPFPCIIKPLNTLLLKSGAL